jgi:hypothetical protein
MPENSVRYEKSDAHVGGIFAFAAGLLALGLVVQLASAWLFDDFRESAHRDERPMSALAARERPRLPRDLSKIPPPRLQENEPADLKTMRETEDRRLNSYGWVDAEAGVVHIPITEAMRLLSDPKIAHRNGIRIEPMNGER